MCSLKRCFKCKTTQDIDQFYEHPQMSDGHLGKCKKCCRSDSLANRAKNIDKIREYDRLRGNRQSQDYYKSEKYRKSHNIASEKYRINNPQKRNAHMVVDSAIRSGALKRMPCGVCGDVLSEAHHEDYNKPLDVQWLCQKHHKIRHKKLRELKRKILHQKKL